MTESKEIYVQVMIYPGITADLMDFLRENYSLEENGPMKGKLTLKNEVLKDLQTGSIPEALKPYWNKEQGIIMMPGGVKIHPETSRLPHDVKRMKPSDGGPVIYCIGLKKRENNDLSLEQMVEMILKEENFIYVKEVPGPGKETKLVKEELNQRIMELYHQYDTAASEYQKQVIEEQLKDIFTNTPYDDELSIY